MVDAGRAAGLAALLLASACGGEKPVSNEGFTLAELGEGAFRPCATCHYVEAGRGHQTGPNLRGVYGRNAGTAPGFRYSGAMAASGLIWNEETLDRYLENPQGVVRGTVMAWPGVSDPEERAMLIAYLKTLEQP